MLYRLSYSAAAKLFSSMVFFCRTGVSEFPRLGRARLRPPIGRGDGPPVEEQRQRPVQISHRLQNVRTTFNIAVANRQSGLATRLSCTGALILKVLDLLVLDLYLSSSVSQLTSSAYRRMVLDKLAEHIRIMVP